LRLLRIAEKSNLQQRPRSSCALHEGEITRGIERMLRDSFWRVADLELQADSP
jgi:hypothetical protein